MRSLVSVFVAIVVALLVGLPAGHAQQNVQGNLPKVGDEVRVKWGGSEFDALIVSTNGMKLKIRYHKWGSGTEVEDVTPDRVTFKGKVLTSAQLANSGANLPAATGKSPPSTMRTWTDASGLYKIEAAFISLADEKVELKKADGTTIRLPLDKLSPADQDEAKKLAKSSAATPINPFETPADATASGSNATSPGVANESGSAEYASKDADSSAARIVQLEGPNRFSIPPDPMVKPSFAITKNGIPLKGNAGGAKSKSSAERPKKEPFWEAPLGLAFHPSSKDGLVFIQVDKRNSQQGTDVERVNLATGEVKNTHYLSATFTPDSCAAGGTLVAGRKLNEKPHFSEWDRVQVWDFKAAGEPRCVLTFSPSGAAKSQKLGRVTWLGEDHLVTLTEEGKLVVWKYPSLEAVYTIHLGKDGKYALSGYGKYLAVSADPGTFVLNADTGNVIGQCGETIPEKGALAFSQDGTQLALASNLRVVVWDLATGTQTREISYPKPAPVVRIDWNDKDQLTLGMTNGEIRIVDLSRGVVLWSYSGLPFNQDFAGQQWSLLRGHNSPWGLGHLSLPHPAAKTAAAKLKSEDIALLKPGATVALSINLPFDPADVQTIRAALAKQITDGGMTIVDQSPIVIECSTAAGESKELTFRPFGRAAIGNRTETKVTVTPTTSSVTVKENGAIVWQTQYTTSTHAALMLKEGETIEGAMANISKPKPQFFLLTKLPRTLSRHPASGSYGQSLISVSGIVDQTK